MLNAISGGNWLGDKPVGRGNDHAQIFMGVALLSIALISGMLLSEEIFGKPLQLNHKTVFSIDAWMIYAWLLFGRFQYGWRGKMATRWTLVGFILLLLAYVGSRFVMQVMLNR